MTIKEERYITIDKKIITRADVEKLAKVVYSNYKRKRGRVSKGYIFKNIAFSVKCEGDTAFSSQEPEIFAADSPINSKRVIKIDMNYRYDSQEGITVKLEHNPYYAFENSISVEGDNSNWVNGTLKRLEEVVDEFSPQNTIIWERRTLLQNIIALSIGLFLANFIIIPVTTIMASSDSQPSSELLKLMNAYPLLGIVGAYTLKYVGSWALGSIPAELLLHWLQKLFPRVELQIGPEHKMIEKRQRVQIANIISVTGVVSLVLQIIYDLAKGVF